MSSPLGNTVSALTIGLIPKIAPKETQAAPFHRQTPPVPPAQRSPLASTASDITSVGPLVPSLPQTPVPWVVGREARDQLVAGKREVATDHQQRRCGTRTIGVPEHGGGHGSIGTWDPITIRPG
jgi:hypothetical protein